MERHVQENWSACNPTRILLAWVSIERQLVASTSKQWIFPHTARRPSDASAKREDRSEPIFSCHSLIKLWRHSPELQLVGPTSSLINLHPTTYRSFNALKNARTPSIFSITCETDAIVPPHDAECVEDASCSKHVRMEVANTCSCPRSTDTAVSALQHANTDGSVAEASFLELSPAISSSTSCSAFSHMFKNFTTVILIFFLQKPKHS